MAAMATVNLEVFEKTADSFGADAELRRTGHVIGVSDANVENTRRSLAAQRQVGVPFPQCREVGKPDPHFHFLSQDNHTSSNQSSHFGSGINRLPKHQMTLNGVVRDALRGLGI